MGPGATTSRCHVRVSLRGATSRCHVTVPRHGVASRACRAACRVGGRGCAVPLAAVVCRAADLGTAWLPWLPSNPKISHWPGDQDVCGTGRRCGYNKRLGQLQGAPGRGGQVRRFGQVGPDRPDIASRPTGTSQCTRETTGSQNGARTAGADDRHRVRTRGGARRPATCTSTGTSAPTDPVASPTSASSTAAPTGTKRQDPHKCPPVEAMGAGAPEPRLVNSCADLEGGSLEDRYPGGKAVGPGVCAGAHGRCEREVPGAAVPEVLRYPRCGDQPPTLPSTKLAAVSW